MGLAITKEDFDDGDRARFAERLRDDLQALEHLLQKPGFGEGPTTIGAELELTLVDADHQPLPHNRALMNRATEPDLAHLQVELDRFNLEYNLTPVPMDGSPFSALQEEMRHALGVIGDIAGSLGGGVAAIGILPTLHQRDLQHTALSDLPRYRALSAALRKLRGEPFHMHIEGQDSLDVACDDVTFEGANNSLQVHLRVPPRHFPDTYNAAQLVTPAAVAVGANSPLFLGHRLWDETRIALFKQAVDSRGRAPKSWRVPPRVSFGHGWVRRSALELFSEAVALFPPLLPVTGDEDPLGEIAAGRLPRLQELRLHQGTVWLWNRAIYDSSAGGHLRIELRSLPSGPTPVDMAANAAFLVGATRSLRDDVDRLLAAFPFDMARHNFYQAAQHGLDATLLWPTHGGRSPREIGATELIGELLPRAREGLAALGVEAEEAERLLSVIRERTGRRMSPARWQRHVLANLERSLSRERALRVLTERYLERSATGEPVHRWSTAA